MTAAATVPFPSSRTLAAWWPELRPLAPEAVWLTHLVLHRVEALVRRATSAELAPLARLVLEAAAAGHVDELPLAPSLRGRLLADLTANDLVRRAEAGGWELTAAGATAASTGRYDALGEQRRTFAFLDAPGEPRFVPLDGGAGHPWPAAEDWHFDVRVLEACLTRPEEWKRRRGFPADVRGVVKADPTHSGGDKAWQRVVVDRPEHWLLLLVLTRGDESERLRGYPIDTAGWRWHSEAVLTLGEAWPEVFPELAAAPSAEDWRAAWHSWAQPRNLPATEIEACRLEPAGVVLRVEAPASLVARLHALNSDAIRGETWLTSGPPPTCRVMRVEVATQH